MEEKLQKLYDYIEDRCAHGVYRSSFFDLAGESLRETLGQPRQIRRAKALENVLGKMELVVQPYELLGGTIAGIYPRVEVPSYKESKEEGRKRILEYVEERKKNGAEKWQRQALYGRILYHGRIEFADMQQIIDELTVEMGEQYDLSRAEIGYLMEKLFTWDFGENGRLVGELPWEATNHNDINPPKFLNRGLASIREEILERQATCAPEQKEFYDAVKIAIDAVISFIRRYGDAYADAAKAEADEERRAELARIADACHKVCTQKPETFFEALQLLWMIYEISHIQAAAGSCAAFALFDRYMYPFYKADLDAGRITEDEAQRLICNMYLKINEPKMRSVISVTLGGQLADGTAVANDITRLCLRAVQILRQPFPNVGLRLFEGTPDWLYDMAIDTIKMGTGNPQIINDRTWIPNFERHGYSHEDACEYYNMGCVEMMIMGRIARWCNMVDVNFPDTLERVFKNDKSIAQLNDSYGFDESSWKIFTPSNGISNFPQAPLAPLKTPDMEQLDTFEKFLDAYKAQIYHALSNQKEQSDICDRIHDEYWCDPFASLFHEACLERGADIYRGGAKYDAVKVISGFGLGTAVDSLLAIKRYVYEEKRVTLKELYRMMQEDFKNDELFRNILENGISSYGNDGDEADSLARTVFGWFADATEAVNRAGIRGVAITSCFSYNAQVSLGEMIGAMPNGRHKGEMISDSIGPSQGKDVSGPVRMLNSVASIDPAGITGACSVNLKLSPAVVKGKVGSENMKALFKGFFDKGGVQLQVNYVDSDTLRAAQVDPKKYSNLIVRIAGYCEYFNNLDRNLQNEIIARSEHGM